MEKEYETKTERIVSYPNETFKNKICAIAIIILGALCSKVAGDGGALVITSVIGIPMFFAKKNIVF